jgi:hypothetical protein
MAYKKSNPYVYKPGPMRNPDFVYKRPDSGNDHWWWLLCVYMLFMGCAFAFSSKPQPDTAAGMYAVAAVAGTIGYTTRKRYY